MVKLEGNSNLLVTLTFMCILTCNVISDPICKLNTDFVMDSQVWKWKKKSKFGLHAY